MGKPYTVVWDIFLHFILGLESLMFARELTLLTPALFYPFLPISISTHPQSEDERQTHMDSIYFSPDLGDSSGFDCLQFLGVVVSLGAGFSRISSFYALFEKLVSPLQPFIAPTAPF